MGDTRNIAIKKITEMSESCVEKVVIFMTGLEAGVGIEIKKNKEKTDAQKSA